MPTRSCDRFYGCLLRPSELVMVDEMCDVAVAQATVARGLPDSFCQPRSYMQVTLCDVCARQSNGITHFVIPLERCRDPDTVGMDLCPLCIGQLLFTLVRDHGKAALLLGEWIRKVQRQ